MKKKIIVLFCLIISSGIAFVIWDRSAPLPGSGNKTLNLVQEKIAFSCLQDTKEFSRDEAMKGLIPNGGTYRLLKNYYACNPMRRGEIVAVSVEGAEHPIPRIVRAVPGDQIEVLPAPQRNGFTLKINGEMLFASDLKRPEVFGAGHWKKGPDDSIPAVFHRLRFALEKDEFLVFSYIHGNGPDSATFGPVKSSQIVGRGLLD